MDPVTTAIIASLAAGATSGLTDAAKKAITDGYEGLKSLIKRKFGDKSKSTEAIKTLESEPDFKPYQDGLAQRLMQAGVTDDPEIIAAAKTLIELMKNDPQVGKEVTQIIASGDRSVAIGGDVKGGTIITGDQTTYSGKDGHGS